MTWLSPQGEENACRRFRFTIHAIHPRPKGLGFSRLNFIITANEGDLGIPKEKKDIYGKYQFDLENTIVATYKDIPSEMIFKREY